MLLSCMSMFFFVSSSFIVSPLCLCVFLYLSSTRYYCLLLLPSILFSSLLHRLLSFFLPTSFHLRPPPSFLFLSPPIFSSPFHPPPSFSSLFLPLPPTYSLPPPLSTLLASSSVPSLPRPCFLVLPFPYSHSLFLLVPSSSFSSSLSLLSPLPLRLSPISSSYSPIYPPPSSFFSPLSPFPSPPPLSKHSNPSAPVCNVTVGFGERGEGGELRHEERG